MSRRIEELDWRSTELGEISLRRRREPVLDVDVYEVRLGEEFLMSSLFTVAEEELARLALAALPGDDLDVLVGGLGLGYTARAVLADRRVRSLDVVEALPDVISWQERGLLPLSDELTGDPRCRLVHGDFFALLRSGSPIGPAGSQRYSAVVVDIDHTPDHLLHDGSASFYTVTGLGQVADRLHPGGVFALWSDAPPDDGFSAVLASAFPTSSAHVVPFANHLTGGTSTNTVYLGRLD